MKARGGEKAVLSRQGIAMREYGLNRLVLLTSPLIFDIYDLICVIPISHQPRRNLQLYMHLGCCPPNCVP